MAHIVKDMVRESATITGASDPYALAGAVAGYIDFDTVMANSDTCWYRATDGTNWEVGLGTFTAGSPDQLARTTVLSSSNSNNAVVWGSSTQVDVILTVPASTLMHIAAQGVLVNGKITEAHAASAATFAIKGLDGNDPSASNPVLVIFPDGTQRAITAANSVVIPSTATLGFVNGTAARIWLCLVDDGGTLRLGVQNCFDGSSIMGLPAKGIITTTTIDTSSDSAGVTYTGTGATAKQFVVVAFADYESGLTAAGTWDASPTRIELYSPGMPLPGDEIQIRSNQTASSATGTTLTPIDDTIPQNTEGDEYMSQAITPTSICNILEIETEAYFATNAAAGTAIMTHLHQDSVANAFAAAVRHTPGANYISGFHMSYRKRCGSTSSQTYKVRAGGSASGTLTFNGNAGSRAMGGVFNSYLRVREFMG